MNTPKPIGHDKQSGHHQANREAPNSEVGSPNSFFRFLIRVFVGNFLKALLVTFGIALVSISLAFVLLRPSGIGFAILGSLLTAMVLWLSSIISSLQYASTQSAVALVGFLNVGKHLSETLAKRFPKGLIDKALIAAEQSQIINAKLKELSNSPSIPPWLKKMLLKKLGKKLELFDKALEVALKRSPNSDEPSFRQKLGEELNRTLEGMLLSTGSRLVLLSYGIPLVMTSVLVLCVYALTAN